MRLPKARALCEGPRITAYFRGPVNLKHTVYPSTSTLNISQYCVMKPIKKSLQFDFRSFDVGSM